LFYWFLKFVAIGPVVRVLFRPEVEGVENVPATPAPVMSIHLPSALLNAS